MLPIIASLQMCGALWNFLENQDMVYNKISYGESILADAGWVKTLITLTA